MSGGPADCGCAQEPTSPGKETTNGQGDASGGRVPGLEQTMPRALLAWAERPACPKAELRLLFSACTPHSQHLALPALCHLQGLPRRL